MLRVASFGDAFAELKLPPSATVSPSSTLDLLPEQAAPSPSKTTQRRVVDQAPHHALRIVDGRCLSSGDSALEEEGECFIAHLGLGEEWGMPVERPTAMSLPEGSAPIMEVAAGDMHSLLLDRSGAVWSCGGGWEGPLGHGDPASSAVPRPILALAAVRIDRIAAGGVHSLALSETGQVWSWGWGIYGQLGHGDTRSLSAPRRIEAAPPAVVQVRGPLCSDPILTPPFSCRALTQLTSACPVLASADLGWPRAHASRLPNRPRVHVRPRRGGPARSWWRGAAADAARRRVPRGDASGGGACTSGLLPRPWPRRRALCVGRRLRARAQPADLRRLHANARPVQPSTVAWSPTSLGRRGDAVPASMMCDVT